MCSKGSCTRPRILKDREDKNRKEQFQRNDSKNQRKRIEQKFYKNFVTTVKISFLYFSFFFTGEVRLG